MDRGDVEQLLNLIDGLWALHEARGWYHAAIELAKDILDVIATSGRSAEFASEELTLSTGLARAVMAVGGYNVEAEAAFTRALELARASGASAQEFSVLRSLASYYNQRTSWDAAVEIGRQLLELGEQTRDLAMLAEGHYVIGASTLFSAPQSALSNLDQAISLWDSKAPTVNRFRLGPNSAILARTASAMMLWDSGNLDQSVSRMSEALRLARTLDHPYSIAYALYHSGFLAIRRSRLTDCLEYARELAEVSIANDYQVWTTLAKLLEGVATAGLGRANEGLVMTETAVDLYQGLTPPPAFWPFVLMLRAAVHAMAGKAELAIELLNEASAAVASLGVDPPALRVMKADVMRMLPDPEVEAIEALYLAAIETGEATGLRLSVLTGWTGLVTLRRQIGRTPDGSEELAVVYRSFAEAEDEHDVITARKVLGEAGTEHKWSAG
jgi:tetratricopeptide (TPR) repeat protein